MNILILDMLLSRASNSGQALVVMSDEPIRGNRGRGGGVDDWDVIISGSALNDSFWASCTIVVERTLPNKCGCVYNNNADGMTEEAWRQRRGGPTLGSSCRASQ